MLSRIEPSPLTGANKFYLGRGTSPKQPIQLMLEEWIHDILYPLLMLLRDIKQSNPNPNRRTRENQFRAI